MSGPWGNPLTQSHPLQVRISFTIGGVQCQTGFKLRDQSATASNPQHCAENVGAFCEANFRQLFQVEERLDGVDVLDLVTGEGGGYSFNNVTGTANTGGPTLMPTYVTAPVSMKGELRRRYGQGRMILPVRLEAWCDGTTLNGAGVAAINGFLTAMQAEYMASPVTKTYRLITAHGIIAPKAATPTSPARPQVEPTWYDVTTLRLNTRLSFLRSRRD